VMTIDNTDAKMGRLMKKREIKAETLGCRVACHCLPASSDAQLSIH
jgi:hypothetical protein